MPVRARFFDWQLRLTGLDELRMLPQLDVVTGGRGGMKVIVTGGAGFIGSAVCRHLIRSTDWSVINLDKLTYAANVASLASVAASPRYYFVQADIADRETVRALFEQVRPAAVLNLAAESHG